MSVMVTNTEGKQSFGAKYFIDATGDANLSVMCGCRYQLGRKEDNRCQPMTLCFRITNIDVDGVHKSIHDINRLYKQYQQMGKIKNCRENVLMFRNIIENTMHFNSTSVIGCNPVDAFELSQAERTAREQMFELFDFLKTNFKCFEKSEIMMSASQIGIRESRMIDGEYVLCGDDIRQCKKNFVTQ